jgi:signal transduction histidine kinase
LEIQYFALQNTLFTLLAFSDHYISPAILEDLGLTAALQWLVNNFLKNDSVNVSVNIADIDNFFPEDQQIQIIIYRIAQ